MSAIIDALTREESQLNNLLFARGSIGKPDAFLTSEQLEAMIVDQRAIVEDLRTQAIAASGA